MARWSSKLGALAAETKRRNVFKVAGVYAVTAWGASLGAAELLPAFGAPDWAVRAFVVAAILGLPIAAVLAWAFEITPSGIVRDPTPTLSRPPEEAGPPVGDTTVMFGARGVVHVAWTNGGTRHEQSFVRDFRLGRDAGCEIHIDDPMISRRHAAVSYQDGRWWISDLGSRNGTLLDGQPVTRAPLPASCKVRLYAAGPSLQLDVRAPGGASTVAAHHTIRR